jgi:hypothetical protein
VVIVLNSPPLQAGGQAGQVRAMDARSYLPAVEAMTSGELGALV